MNYTLEELKYYLPFNGGDKFYELVYAQASNAVSTSVNELSLSVAADTIVREMMDIAVDIMEAESALDYDDEIVSIEPIGEMELMDITVSRNNLFYANGILTKNSTGIPATLDGMWAVIRTEELDGIGQLLISEIKTRYGDKSIPKFTVGVNINTQRLYDVHENEQKKFVTNSPAKRFERDAEEVERRNEKAVASAKGRFTGFKVTNDD